MVILGFSYSKFVRLFFILVDCFEVNPVANEGLTLGSLFSIGTRMLGPKVVKDWWSDPQIEFEVSRDVHRLKPPR